MKASSIIQSGHLPRWQKQEGKGKQTVGLEEQMCFSHHVFRSDPIIPQIFWNTHCPTSPSFSELLWEQNHKEREYSLILCSYFICSWPQICIYTLEDQDQLLLLRKYIALENWGPNYKVQPNALQNNQTVCSSLPWVYIWNSVDLSTLLNVTQ